MVLRLLLRRIGGQENAFGPNQRRAAFFILYIQRGALLHQELQDVVRSAIRRSDHRRDSHGVHRVYIRALL